MPDYTPNPGAFPVQTRSAFIYSLKIEPKQNDDALNYNLPENTPKFHLGPKLRVNVQLDHAFELGRGGIAWLMEDIPSSKLVVCTKDGYLQRWARTADSPFLQSLWKLSGTFDHVSRYVYTLEEEVSLSALAQVFPDRISTPLATPVKKKPESHHLEEEVRMFSPFKVPQDLPEEVPPESGEEDLAPEAASAAEDHMDTPREFNVISMESLGKDKMSALVTDTGMAAVLVGVRTFFPRLSFNAFLAYLVTLSQDIREFEKLRCVWMPLDPKKLFVRASAISINMRYHLVAVGLSTGEVELFSLLNDFKYDRKLTLQPWGITEKETGAASALCWTQDGRALAVGYRSRGLSTWSLSGCRLSCTISQTHVLSASTRSADGAPGHQEAVASGVECLAFGPESYSLLFCSSAKNSRLEELGFVKTSLASNPNLNYCQRILLQATDRLHLLNHRLDSSYASFESEGEYKWIQWMIPTSYLLDNWPIRLVSLSHDGLFAAVCGRRGFCIINLQTGQWKMFGDRTEEQQITVRSLCWYGRTLVVTNQVEGAPNSFEFLFFPSWQRLTLKSVLFRAPLPNGRKPLYVDCNDSFLVLFTTDSFFYQYRINSEYVDNSQTEVKRISLRLVQQISVSRAASSPTSLLLLPSSILPRQQQPQSLESSESSSKSATAKCVVLSSNGEMSLQNAEKSINVTLAHHVEQFWMANPTLETSDHELANTLWAYGQFGLEVWFPFFQTGGKSASGTSSTPLVFLSRDRSLEFDLEVYPIGFLPSWAVVVGVSQALSSPGSSMGHYGPIFEIQTKTHPFLHSLIRRMIEKSESIEGALSMCQKYAHVPHFSHSLELLLHEVLEDEYQTIYRSTKFARSNGGSRMSPLSLPPTPLLFDSPSISIPESAGEMLSRVVQLLKRLGDRLYAPLVVACARKTDPVLWGLLFHPKYGADSPQVLFDACLNIGNVTSAASYLRVLQLQDGERAARQAAVKVVDLCLQRKNWGLLRDLVRFLEPESSEAAIVQLKLTPQTPTRGNSGVPLTPSKYDEEAMLESSMFDTPRKGDAEDHFDDDEMLLERSLAKHARQLLLNKRLRELVFLARWCHVPARYWFMQERRRSAIVHDYDEALNALHEQFQIPHPAHGPVAMLLQMQRSASHGAGFLDDLRSSNSSSSSGPFVNEGNTEVTEAHRRLVEYNAVYYPGSDFLLRGSAFASTKSFIAFDVDEVIGDPLAQYLKPAADPEITVQRGFHDLEFLLEEFIAAGCVGWTLLCSTVLFRVRIIQSSLKRNPVFWKVYRPMLEKQAEHCKGYRDLLAHFDSVMNGGAVQMQ